MSRIRKKIFLLSMLSFFLFILSFSPLIATTQEPASVQTVRFLHFNDVYQVSPNKNGIGGLGKIKTLISQMRKNQTDTIVTFGGDLFLTSAQHMLLSCKQTVDLTNQLGIDVAVIGNHEFDNQDPRACFQASQYPWLGTNVMGKNPSWVKSWSKQVGPLKVGFFGILTPDTKTLTTLPADVTITEIINASREAVAKLKAEGAHVIVALTHLTNEEDRHIARHVEDIHLILGGHVHEPIVAFEKGVLIHKAGMDGEYLGVIDLPVRYDLSQKKVIHIAPPTLQMISTQNVHEERNISTLIQSLLKKSDDQSNDILAQTECDLTTESSAVRTRETAFGNMVADAMREYCKSDISLLNGGFIRGNSTYPKGTKFTRGLIFSELPFQNYAQVVSVTGTHLRKILEHTVTSNAPQNPCYPILSSTCKLTYDLSRPQGDRIASIFIHGHPLVPEKTYTVAAPDFMIKGGDGFPFEEATLIKIDREEKKIYNIVEQYLIKKKTISPKIENRTLQINAPKP